MIWKITKKDLLPRCADSEMSPSLNNLLLGTKYVYNSLAKKQLFEKLFKKNRICLPDICQYI